MIKKAKLLQALAFSVAIVPVAEVAAIVAVAHHDFAVFSAPLQHQSSTVRMAVVQDPFSASVQSVHASGSELLMVNSTPVLADIH
jgi:hypothetical protein